MEASCFFSLHESRSNNAGTKKNLNLFILLGFKICVLNKVRFQPFRFGKQAKARPLATNKGAALAYLLLPDKCKNMKPNQHKK
jgi:hypothetical protein